MLSNGLSTRCNITSGRETRTELTSIFRPNHFTSFRILRSIIGIKNQGHHQLFIQSNTSLTTFDFTKRDSR